MNLQIFQDIWKKTLRRQFGRSIEHQKEKNSPELNVAVLIQIALSQNILLVFPDKNPKIFAKS